MDHTNAGRGMRAAGCAALLMLLAVSSYAGAGREQAQIVSVPVMVHTLSQEALSASSLEETRQRLAVEREEALSHLESVLSDPRTDEQTAAQALREKTEMAMRMETEASVGALLSQMGFADTAVIAGEAALSIVVPWQVAENEQNRLRMIDAAAGQAGYVPESVKIILAKK